MLLLPIGSALLSFITFFFNDTATTEIYALSLHDALPICSPGVRIRAETIEDVEWDVLTEVADAADLLVVWSRGRRSEEHTSELQSRQYLVCRLLLEKKE